jgi:2-methylcitrate dehydratase PrpD
VFVGARCVDPLVQRVLDGVEPRHDAALDARYPEIWPVWVRVTSKSGVHELAVDHPRGDPENFPTSAELGAKFRRLAARSLDAAAIDRLDAAIDGFGRAPRAADLLASAQAAGK